MLEIRNLTHYILKESSQKRSRFLCVVDERGYYDEVDVEGHVTLEEALLKVKSMMAGDLIHLALKETMDKIHALDESYEFFGLDLRELIFDIDIFDDDSELYKSFERLILGNWTDEFAHAYYLFSNLKHVKIHDDEDKKTLYDHYFEGLKEFRNRVSFLEYVNSKVTLPIIRQPLPYIDTAQLIDYYIIDDTVKRAEIEYVLARNNVDIKFTKENKSHWEGFAYCYGMDNDLNDFEALSFAKLFSRIVFESDEPLKKNEYIKENLIEERIIQRFFEFPSGDVEAEDQIKDIFYSLFDVYANDIHKYEYKNRKLNFRLSQRQYNRFMNVKGENKAEKLENLIDLYDEIFNSSDERIDIREWVSDDYVEIVNIERPVKNLKSGRYGNG
jgi:hypothetical protein